jgi:hypothetical protein
MLGSVPREAIVNICEKKWYLCMCHGSNCYHDIYEISENTFFRNLFEYVASQLSIFVGCDGGMERFA